MDLDRRIPSPPAPEAEGQGYRRGSRRRKRVQPDAELVALAPDHPGFNDPAYRRRRDAIARLALAHREGEPVPHVRYTAAEHGVWRQVCADLRPLHQELACREYLECARRVDLPVERIPQLAEVNERLARTTGFQMVPVAGLVTDRRYLGSLARGVFQSTQYIRHPSTPRYTPEPDIVHELIGHAATFAHPEVARLNRAFGEAAIRLSDTALQRVGRVYWFTMEFGVVLEGGVPKAFGAGLLSSSGELARLRGEAEIRPLDVDAVSALPYDPTSYQPVLYAADSFEALVGEVIGWLERA